MKKKTAFFLIIPAFLSAAAAVLNKALFVRAEKKGRTLEKEFYETPMGKMAYGVSGSGKPLLLVHGAYPGASSFEWEAIKDELSKHYTVYTPDLLGFGESEKPPVSYSAYTFASGLNGFIRDVIGKKTAAAGSGAGAAFLVKAQSLEPSNFAKLILVAPEGILKRETPKNAGFLKTFIDTSFIGTSLYNAAVSKAATRNFLKKEMFFAEDGISRRFIDACHTSAHIGGVGNKYSFSSYISGYTDIGIKEDLSNIKIPTLLVYGDDRDEKTALELSAAKDSAALASVAIFEETKRLPHVENPEGFGGTAIEFLG